MHPNLHHASRLHTHTHTSVQHAHMHTHSLTHLNFPLGMNKALIYLPIYCIFSWQPRGSPLRELWVDSQAHLQSLIMKETVSCFHLHWSTHTHTHTLKTRSKSCHVFLQRVLMKRHSIKMFDFREGGKDYLQKETKSLSLCLSLSVSLSLLHPHQTWLRRVSNPSLSAACARGMTILNSVWVCVWLYRCTMPV